MPWLYHKADHDGISCGALLLASGISALPYNYGEPLPNGVNLADIDGMADVSLTPELMYAWAKSRRENGKTAIWIDHHKDIYETCNKELLLLGAHIMFVAPESAAMGVWDLLYGTNTNRPRNLWAISRYDTWRHREDTYFHHLGWAARFPVSCYKDVGWHQRYVEALKSEELYDICVKDGTIIYEYEKAQNANIPWRIVFWPSPIAKGKTIPIAIYNGVIHGKMAEGILNRRYKGHFIRVACGYVHRGGDKWSFSLRSRGSVGLARAIAKHFGGNGHPEAAGFVTDTATMLELSNKEQRINS